MARPSIARAMTCLAAITQPAACRPLQGAHVRRRDRGRHSRNLGPGAAAVCDCGPLLRDRAEGEEEEEETVAAGFVRNSTEAALPCRLCAVLRGDGGRTDGWTDGGIDALRQLSIAADEK